MPAAKFLDANGLQYFWSKVTGYVDDSIVSVSADYVDIPPILFQTETSVSGSDGSPVTATYADEKGAETSFDINLESITSTPLNNGTLTSGTPVPFLSFSAPLTRDVEHGTGTLSKISINGIVTLHYPNESNIILYPEHEWPFVVNEIPAVGESTEGVLDSFYNENYYDPRISDNSFGDDSILTGSLEASGFNLGVFKIVLSRTSQTEYQVSLLWTAANDTGIYGSNIRLTATKRDGTTSTIAIPTADFASKDVYAGATASANGTAGLVPAALIAERDKFLKGDGTWAEVSTEKEVGYSTTEPTSQSTASLDEESFIFYETESFGGSSGAWDASISGNAATADSVNHPFIFKVNDGQAEGLNKYSFNGSSTKEVNIEAGTGLEITTVLGTATISGMTYQGATENAAGVAGLVPGAAIADRAKYLKGDGTWAEISMPSTYQGATENANGVGGVVPAATSDERNKYLKGDGTWSEIENVDTSTLLLDNYQKASSASAISSSDSVLQAIGKLEKSLDGKQETLSAVTSLELSTGTDTTTKAVTAKAIHDYVAGEVAGLVNSAPAALDTLSELASALGNDANFATTVTTSIGSKLDVSSADYIKSLSITGQTITYTRGDDTIGTLVTQDIPKAVSNVSLSKRSSILTGFMMLDNGRFAVAYPNTAADYSQTIQYSYSWGMRFKDYETQFNSPTVELCSLASMPSTFQFIFAFIINPDGADDVEKYASALTETEELTVVDAAILSDGRYTTEVSFRGAGLYDWAKGHIEITKPESSYVISITYEFCDRIQNVIDQTMTFTDSTTSEAELVLANFIPGHHTHTASDISGTLDAARIPSLDASKITTGTIDIARLPAGALPILKVVGNEAERFALTSSDVQVGDTVQQTDTGLMYYVKDVTKLNSADGYAVYTAGAATSVPWSGVTDKPSTYAPSAHNQASNTINAMTGYSKPSSTSAIGTSDTLNAAIGKLEKALDGKQASGSYANATHSHVGTEVTLTGYSKASSAAAVEATDTVNAAIGKIEKTLDGKQASGTYLTPTSTLDAAKLSGTIPSECYTDTVYTHPTTSGNKHIPSGGSSGQFLKWSADGTAAWAADNNSTTHLYAGASGATANASSATANNATYLVVCDDSTARSSIQITGTNGTTVSANGGTITIDSVALSAVTNAQIDTLFA